MSRAGTFLNQSHAFHLQLQGEPVTYRSRSLADVSTTAIVHAAEWDIEGVQPGDRSKRMQRVIELHAADITSPRQGDVVIVGSSEEWAVENIIGSRDGWHVVMTKRDEAVTTAGRRLPKP